LGRGQFGPHEFRRSHGAGNSQLAADGFQGQGAIDDDAVAIPWIEFFAAGRRGGPVQSVVDGSVAGTRESHFYGPDESGGTLWFNHRSGNERDLSPGRSGNRQEEPCAQEKSDKRP